MHMCTHLLCVPFAWNVHFPAAGKEVFSVIVKDVRHVYQAGTQTVFLRVSQGSAVVTLESNNGKSTVLVVCMEACCY